MFDETSFSKRMLWRYVNIKINRIIHHYHVFSVITILFDEMLKELKQGKEIKIFNFGTLKLENTKPRKYHDIRYNKVLLSKGSKILKFKLIEPIRKKLCFYLDKKMNGD
jgi:nucleoid DNA-binding protein